MKVYVTKYALTHGIEVKEVSTGSAMDDEYVYSVETYQQQYRMGRTAFLTYPEAAVAARLMRDKKRLSLRNQLAKMGSLVFPTQEPENLK